MAEHEKEQPTNADRDAQPTPDPADGDAQDVPTGDTEPAGDDAQEMREPELDEASTESAQEPSAEAMTEDALNEVEAAAAHLQDEAEQGASESLNLPDFAKSSNGAAQPSQGMGLLSDVSMNVTIELGRTRMYVEDVLKLNANSIVELDKAAGDPVDIYVNDCHVARGEVLVLNENFCVRVSEIVASPPRVARKQ